MPRPLIYYCLRLLLFIFLGESGEKNIESNVWLTGLIIFTILKRVSSMKKTPGRGMLRKQKMSFVEQLILD